MDHLNNDTAFASMETYPIEYASAPYGSLISEVCERLTPNHDITYVPFTHDQVVLEAEHITYAESSDLPRFMRDAGAIICISRDEDPTPDYSDRYPEYNITLTPSGRSNVDTSVMLYGLAKEAGNADIKFISTGRMHNRAVRAMLALPLVAEHIGINAEDLYHIPEAQFKKLLDAGFARENIADLRLDLDGSEVDANRKALIDLLQDPQYEASVPSEGATDEELQRASAAIWAEYKKFPRISTSRLMVERAILQGVPAEAIQEEDGAVDTITNLVNTATMLQTAEGLKDKSMHSIVIVAGSDHLPRTMWIADHVLPDGVQIVCIESDPSLDQVAYDESCNRELNSFRKGSVWISDTRDLTELTRITEAGYFSVGRKDAQALANEITANHTQG